MCASVLLKRRRTCACVHFSYVFYGHRISQEKCWEPDLGDKLRTAVRKESLFSESHKGPCKLCNPAMASKSDDLRLRVNAVINGGGRESEEQSRSSFKFYLESLLKRHVNTNLADEI